MSKQQSTERLVCTWVPVRDARGRTHMEARWSAPAMAVRTAA